MLEVQELASEITGQHVQLCDAFDAWSSSKDRPQGRALVLFFATSYLASCEMAKHRPRRAQEVGITTADICVADTRAGAATTHKRQTSLVLRQVLLTACQQRAAARLSQTSHQTCCIPVASLRGLLSWDRRAWHPRQHEQEVMPDAHIALPQHATALQAPVKITVLGSWWAALLLVCTTLMTMASAFTAFILYVRPVLQVSSHGL